MLESLVSGQQSPVPIHVMRRDGKGLTIVFLSLSVCICLHDYCFENKCEAGVRYNAAWWQIMPRFAGMHRYAHIVDVALFRCKVHSMAGGVTCVAPFLHFDE